MHVAYYATNRVICPTTIPNSFAVCNGKLHFRIECSDSNYTKPAVLVYLYIVSMIIIIVSHRI